MARKNAWLAIKKYSEEKLTAELQNGFDKIHCITEDHITHFTQGRIFCFVVSNDTKTGLNKRN